MDSQANRTEGVNVQPESPTHLGARSLPEALDRAVAHAGDRTSVRYFDAEYTFGEVQGLAWALASHWQDEGVRHGDRVLVQLQNVPQFVLAALAAWEVGAVVVPVSPMYRAREIRRIVDDAGPLVWVTSPEVWNRQGQESVQDSSIREVVLTGLADLGEGVPESFLGIEPADVMGGEGATRDLRAVLESHRGRRPERPEFGGEDTAVLTYTSGTTGPPKAAMNSHANLLWVGHCYPAFNGVPGADQVLLCTAPLVHITGVAMHLASWLTEACELVLNYRFDPAVHLDLIERFRATWSTGTATAYMAMLQQQTERPRDLGSLRFLGCGGSAVPTEVVRRIPQAFGVELGPGYGLTESTAAVCSTPTGTAPRVDDASGITSVGPAIYETRIRIADPEGKDVPAGERGEVLLQGPGIVSGYWRNDEATAEAFTDGWVRTGDIGFLDEDGWLFIVDRTKNMIVVSGYKVWPREVEDVLYAHPAVREVAVVGAPDDYRGETVVACVSLNQEGSQADWETLQHQLRAFSKERMAAYKVPGRFVLREDLPKNFNGKIQHRELRAEVASRTERTDAGGAA